MNRLDDSNTYPIREFARLTGVNPVTLRAWERRYGIIRPERTAKGHRFYTEDHIEQVKHILYWLDQGYPIRQVRLLLQQGNVPQKAQDDDWQEQQKLVAAAAQSLNGQRLDELWNLGFATYPLAVYFDHCLRPALHNLRLNSDTAVSKVTHHLLKRRFNTLLMQQQRHNPGPPVLIACDHSEAESEALACACALGAAEFRVEYFGCDLTAADLQYVSQHLQPSHVWLHLHPLTLLQNLPLTEMREQLNVPLLISGLTSDAVSDSNTNNLNNPAGILMQGSLSQQIREFITGQQASVESRS